MAIESCDRDNEERVQVVLTGKASPIQGKEEVSVAYIPPWSKRLKQESMKALTGGSLFNFKALKGAGVNLRNTLKKYKFKRKNINFMNAIFFILMLKI